MLTATAFVPVSAAEVGEVKGFPVKAAENTVTTVVYTNGSSQSLDGMADASALESWAGISRVASYSVSYNGEEAFSVTLNDIIPEDSSSVAASESRKINGYYAVSFDMPESRREVFLTGLTPNNLALTQEKILKGYQSGKDFELQSIEYIDTEKTEATPDDDNLCWAAASSNILTYTGWADKYNEQYGEPDAKMDTDTLFELFIDNFYDGGSDLDAGASWFFNGVYPFAKGAAFQGVRKSQDEG